MSKERIEELIIRFIEGNCPDEGMRELLEWVKECPENRDTLFGMKDIYDRSRLSATLTEEQINEGWMRLAAECGIDESDARAAMLRPAGQQPAVRKKIPVLRRIAIAAGSLAACVALWFGGSILFAGDASQEMIVVTNDSGRQSHLVLPDGSGVWLYYGTTLRYPQQFEKGVRKVELTGEAFFDVVKDQTRPFIVKSELSKVEVLSTRFNMRATGDTAQVVLESGSVNIGRVVDGHVVRKVLLQPGEMGEVHSSDELISVEKVDLQLYTSWKDAYLNVKSQRFEDVARMLAKRYNTTIRIDGCMLREERFSGRFSQEQSLDEIFGIIDLTMPIHYRQESGGWIISARN